MIGGTVRSQNEMSLCVFRLMLLDCERVRFRYFQPELQFFLACNEPCKGILALCATLRLRAKIFHRQAENSSARNYAFPGSEGNVNEIKSLVWFIYF